MGRAIAVRTDFSRELARNRLPSGRYSPLHAAGADHRDTLTGAEVWPERFGCRVTSDVPQSVREICAIGINGRNPKAMDKIAVRDARHDEAGFIAFK